MISQHPCVSSRPFKAFFVLVLAFAIIFWAWNTPARVEAGGAKQLQQAPEPAESLVATFKKEEVAPVLEVLRKHATARRPDLIRQLDLIELEVPEQRNFNPNASAYRWGRSDIVIINLPLLLDFTVLAELVAVSSTGHPNGESVYNEAVVAYEDYLQHVHPQGMGGEPWIIYSTLRRGLSDALAIDSISKIGKIIRHDIVAWVVLHEISHHILGHTAIDSSGLSLAQNRRLELDADISSFGLLNDLGLSLINLRSLFALRSRMEPLLIKYGYEPQEVKSDHPSWATRLGALDSYMEKYPPRKSPWIAFGSDKFVADERLPGTYELITIHDIFPTEPTAWNNLGFDAKYKTPVAVSFENGEAHLYWADKVFLGHLVIESPYSYSSRTTLTMTSVSDGKRFTSYGIVTRDSAFRWPPDEWVGGVSLSEFQASPQKDAMLKAARSITQDSAILLAMDGLITEFVKSNDAVFLAYMKGTIAEGQYMNALRLSYKKMANDLTAMIGAANSAELLSFILDSPFYKARGIYRYDLGIPD